MPQSLAVLGEFGQARGEQARATAQAGGGTAGEPDAGYQQRSSGKAKSQQTMTLPQQHGDENQQKNDAEADKEGGEDSFKEETASAQLFFLQLNSEEFEPGLDGSQPGIGKPLEDSPRREGAESLIRERCA